MLDRPIAVISISVLDNLYDANTEDGKIAISSAECGMRLSVGSTKAEAIRELKRTINKVGDVTLRKNIRMAIERFGKSPYKAA